MTFKAGAIRITNNGNDLTVDSRQARVLIDGDNRLPDIIAAADGADGGTDSGILFVDVQLSNDQILNLVAAPVEILPALPHATYLPVGHSWEIYDVTNAAYGLGAGSAAVATVGLMGAGGDAGLVVSPWFNLDNGSLTDSGLVVVSTHYIGESATVFPFQDNRASNSEDRAVAIAGVGVGGVEYTDGDPANTLSLRIWYVVVPTVPFGA